MYGAILGDIVGSPYEFDCNNYKAKDFPLFSRRSDFTDDTLMTLAVAKALLGTRGQDDAAIKAALVHEMQRLGRAYPDRGYGTHFGGWLYEDDPQPYRVNGSVPDTPDVCPADLPDCEAKEYRGEMAFFDLQYEDLLKEYEGKLVIDWGGSARMWHQKATTEKPIVAIESKNQKPFVGFENLILSFDELKEVVENDTDYELWRAAMAAVNAVYLIVDTKTGNRYVGSTYGYDGLLGRWSVYVATGGHGNNKGMISHLKSVNHSCHDLQFSVLQVLSKALPDNQIIDAETLWKKKQLTYEPLGMNAN